MRVLFFILSACAVLALPAGCSKPAAPDPRPLVVLASDERGTPQLDYAGPGALNYQYSFGSFSFDIGPVAGTRWIKAKGEITARTNSEVTISIHSSSDRAYDLQVWGVSTNGSNLPEDKAKETVSVDAGNQTINLRRFVIWTYDFTKR